MGIFLGSAFPNKIDFINQPQNKRYSQVFNVFQFTKSIGRHIRQFVAVQVPDVNQEEEASQKKTYEQFNEMCRETTQEFHMYSRSE